MSPEPMLLLRNCPLCAAPDLYPLDPAGWICCKACGPQPRTRQAALAAARNALQPKQPTN